MKRLVPVALAALLALGTAPVPAATAASSSLSQAQTQELVESYAHLTGDFYKKVDRQAALDGARTSIIELLKKRHVANPTLPQLRADVHQLTEQRQAAQLLDVMLAPGFLPDVERKGEKLKAELEAIRKRCAKLTQAVGIKAPAKKRLRVLGSNFSA